MNGNFVADYDPAHTPILSIDGVSRGGAAGHARSRRAHLLPGRAVPPGLRDHVADASVLHVSRKVPAAPPSGRFHRPGLWRLSESGHRARRQRSRFRGAARATSPSGCRCPGRPTPQAACTVIRVFETPQGGPFNVDPYLPTFWAPRAPNEVLTGRRLPDRDGHYQAAGGPDRGLQPPARVDPQPVHQCPHPGSTSSRTWSISSAAMGVMEKRPGITGDPISRTRCMSRSLPDLVPLRPRSRRFSRGQPRYDEPRALMRLRFGGRRP